MNRKNTHKDANTSGHHGPAPTQGDEIDLNRIAEEFSQAIRQGDSPDIEEYASQYPEYMDQIRELLKSISLIEVFKKKNTPVVETVASQPRLTQLDDYEIISEIGRGGMGIVFEAIHQSLGRKVAVKVLANNLLGDEKHLTRFRREARAAAKLRHTNIVPVFGVGSSGNHHYYVMDYIDGMSLHQWLGCIGQDHTSEAPTVDTFATPTAAGTETEASPIPDGPTPRECDVPRFQDSTAYQRWVARLGISAADALHYAHTQGVLHRDIKPANLLLDSQGTLWIADFGLAKFVEQQAVTATGDIVGTPQYMPPESFEGTYDIRSEVYALGLTLYELLTLQPAIEGKGTADIIRKATKGISVLPRKLNPLIAPDLETILLKALAHDPDNRYPDAQQLRNDLQCFLTDRPITARRVSTAERVIRWSRREPKVAALTFTTFGLLVALAAVSAFGFWQTREALNRAQASELTAQQSLKLRTSALQVAEEQRGLAEQNLHVAIAALNEVMENISNRGIEAGAEFLGEVTDTTSPNVTPQDAELLNSLLGFFDELGRNNSKDLLAESAVAAKYAGDICLRFGDLQKAERSFNEALNRTVELAKCDPNETKHMVSQAAILNELAMITGLRGKLRDADAIFVNTRNLLQSCPDVMSTKEGKFHYAIAHRLVASHATRIGLDEPNLYQRAGRPWVARRARNNDPPPQIEKAWIALSECIKVLNGLVQTHPQEQQYFAELARAYRDKAVTASLARRRAEAETAIRQSIALFDELLNANPMLDSIRYELALTLSCAETFNMDYLRRSVRAHELCGELLDKSPDLPHYRALNASIQTTLAMRQMRMERYEAASRIWNGVLNIYDSLIQDSPDVILYQRRHCDVLESLADLKVRQGDYQAAQEYLERAIERLEIAMLQSPDSAIVRLYMRRLTQRLRRHSESHKSSEAANRTED